ncbi:hypothetical protein [Cellulosimicrobium sp. NPDC057127]|uniref:hypothetical protein n=1 Tax=Cellulosimicrobium sp. NPDC057127 TaxID=3346026 RepID=UPI003644AE5A
MSYLSRPTREMLPQFRGDLKNGYNPFQLRRFDTFVAEQYAAGRSLREIGELTGRTQTAVRRQPGPHGDVAARTWCSARGRPAALMSGLADAARRADPERPAAAQAAGTLLT